MDQPDLFATDAPAQPGYRPDPEKVRARLDRILREAREADVMPWGSARVSLYRTIVPDMSRWLPDSEGIRVREAFAAELARLTTVSD